ncbi:MAG: hypothetical protein IKP65_08275 [Alphaproteobacteria bacterium]|nr:hypothetical protein [Alphaproteobacteria bacterium]
MDTLILCCVIPILLLAFGSCIYNTIGEIYTLSDHYGWNEFSHPNKMAKIKNITSQKVKYTKNKAKLKTIVNFSDGFYFITYKTNRKSEFLGYSIFISNKLKKYIIHLAIQKHKIAVVEYFRNR